MPVSATSQFIHRTVIVENIVFSSTISVLNAYCTVSVLAARTEAKQARVFVLKSIKATEARAFVLKPIKATKSRAFFMKSIKATGARVFS
jgi:hypothetical protein